MTRAELERDRAEAPSELNEGELRAGESRAVRSLRVRGETRSVHVDDVDEVIGLAAELKQQATDRLTATDLEEIGRELDIEPAYVRKAMVALRDRRQQRAQLAEEEAAEATRAAGRRRRLVAQVSVALGSVFSVVVVALLAKRASLGEARAVVEQNAAQVDNVIERQRTVKERYQDATPSPDRDAMLDGAENRIRIERRRYDEAVAAYNVEAGGAWAGLATGLFGLPARMPLSNEVGRW